MARDRESWLRGEVSRWVADGTIDGTTADRIRSRYPATSESEARNTLLTVFAVIGVSLFLLGAIVVMAFNWDEIPRLGRVGIAFSPLVLSYCLAVFSFLRRADRPAWRESACVAAILGFAACAGILSQIYHIRGQAEDLILVSAVLALPFVYALRSNAGTLVYLAALTAWTSLTQIHGGDSLVYWPLFAAIAPRLVMSMRANRYSSTSAYLGWVVSLCLFVGLGVSLEKALPGVWIVSYALVFACLRLAGSLAFGDAPTNGANPFGSAGFLGSYLFAFLLTYSWPWREIGWVHYRVSVEGIHASAAFADYLIAGGLLACLGFLAALSIRKRRFAPLTEAGFAVLTVICYLLASAIPEDYFFGLLIIHLLINAWLLGAGVFHILRGYLSGRLGLVNLGTLILCALICLRFVFVEGFFENMIVRGIVFMCLGAGFLAVNFTLSRKLSKEAVR
jgi:Predicted membrane protein (DUF2157)